MKQKDTINLEELVPKEHKYRRIKQVWDANALENLLKKFKSSGPYKGYGIQRLFLCLLVQAMEDLSDRELAIYLQENIAVKWFCGFNLKEKTPDYSVFSKVRRKLGTKLLSDILQEIKDHLKQQGHKSRFVAYLDTAYLTENAKLRPKKAMNF